jgi:hypothetical protein
MMPPQLARAKRPKRTTPRPLAECLTRINVNDLQVPRDYKTYTAPDISFRYPEISNMRISAYQVEFAHNHRIQTFKLKWIRTGAGVPRPAFICDQCARPVISLYFRSQNLGCRRCVGAIYASQVCGKHGRKALQSHRVKQYLSFKPSLPLKTKHRLQARCTSNTELVSKRIGDKAKLPHSNYQVQALALWR